MSAAEKMLVLLKEEEALLRERRFDALGEVQRRKEILLEEMDITKDRAALEKIKQQAASNERLMAVAMTAIKGLRARFAEMGEADSAVGYNRDGARVSVGQEKSKRL